MNFECFASIPRKRCVITFDLPARAAGRALNPHAPLSRSLGRNPKTTVELSMCILSGRSAAW